MLKIRYHDGTRVRTVTTPNTNVAADIYDGLRRCGYTVALFSKKGILVSYH